MAVCDVRVIVITTSLGFYQTIKTGLIAQPDIELIVNVSGEMDLQSKIGGILKNFIIYDVDSVPPTFAYVNQLAQRYKACVVLTAFSQSRVAAYLKGTIKHFVPKPMTYQGPLGEGYVRNLAKILRSFSDSMQTFNFHAAQRLVDTHHKIIAIASSTGGTEALEKIFRSLPEDIPPMLVVQHMPSGFTKLFADRLDKFCKMDIKEASHNDYLQKGLILIAPADYHTILVRQGSRLMVECYKGSKVNGVMPAADVLFDSIAPIMRKNALGVILTGMGADGAIGLKKMRVNGAYTVGQDQATCQIYGMPKAAFDLGAVCIQLPLDRIADKILEWAR